MAINIKFDLLNNPEPPTLILANRNGNKLGQLNVNAESVELIDKFNEASEISFTVNKYLDGKITNLWDKLVDFKLIYCKEWDVWFECKVELDEATESVKTVFCTQLGQAELSQIMLYNIEINTEKDIERDDYKIGILYDPLDSQSILRRLLDKAPHYSIIHVDETLWNIQRSFSFDGTSIYDAFQEIAEEIGCLFVFNSDSDANGMPQRTISVYDLQQNCNNDDCKYRGEFTDKCPKCGSTKIKYGYGDDTLIFVTSDELASEGIQLVTDTDSVKNCFKLEAGDDLMTATVRNRNPNGTDYIWYFSDATKEDMPSELVEKIETYDETYRYYYNEHTSNLNSSSLNKYNNLVNKYLVYNEDLEKISNPIVGFSSLMNAYYNVIDLGWYLKSGLMPDVKMGETNAEEQGSSLERFLPRLIAVTNLDTVSKATADSTVLAMAKAIVSSHYKVTISSSSKSGNEWSGKFVITNYSDEEDTDITSTVDCTLVDWDETYIKQKIDKILSKENTDDLSITGLFEKDYDDFCVELHKYALVPLTSFHDACQACLDMLIEQGIGEKDVKGDLVEIDEEGNFSSEEGNIYKKLYIPYYNKLKAIESEMKDREDEINIVIDLQSDIEKIKINIQDELNFENYLGRDLWLQFCAYRREDKYSNPNYISDGLNNAELFERALQFYEVAENEIFKSAELQHSISATLNNLLAIPKFKPLVESFNVGNWIRVQVDDNIYKLRLVEYEISYKDFDSISVEFSDVAKTKNGYSDLEDILSDASSMASSYDGIQRQANLGNEARDMIRQWMNEGLDASLVQIQNNTNEDIVIDNNGLLGRSYSDITEEYSPEQIKLTHNIIAFTDNNWESVKQAIGKHKYKYYDEGKTVYDDDGNEIKGAFTDAIGYGMSADFVLSGVVAASQIIGGDIYSDNYVPNKKGSYINLRDGTFDFGGGSIKFNGEELKISSPDMMTEDQVTTITKKYIETEEIHAEKLYVNAANVTGKLTSAEIDAGKITSGTISAKRLDLSGVATISSLEDGTTTINGGCITTGTIDASKVKIKNLTVDVAGSISFEDLSDYEDVQKYLDDIESMASDASDIIDEWGYTYEGTTYIDGAMIKTGTVMASKLIGGTVNLLNENKKKAGVMSITGATTSSYAIDLTSYGALRLSAENGSVFIGAGEIDDWNGHIEIEKDGNITIAPPYDGYIQFGAHINSDIYPYEDATYTLGLSGFRWDDIYAANSAIQTSDATKKKNIDYNLNRYEEFYDSLKPTSYQFINNQSQRTHIGFISQDVENALAETGITSQEFAGFVKSPVINKETNEIDGYNYGLRYGEFIALNTWQIQRLKERIAELEKKLENLK